MENLWSRNSIWQGLIWYQNPQDIERRTCRYFVMCRGCPLLPDPARALARTENRGEPSQPHPQPQPGCRLDRKQCWYRISYNSSPQVRRKPGNSHRVVISRCVRVDLPFAQVTPRMLQEIFHDKPPRIQDVKLVSHVRLLITEVVGSVKTVGYRSQKQRQFSPRPSTIG